MNDTNGIAVNKKLPVAWKATSIMLKTKRHQLLSKVKNYMIKLLTTHINIHWMHFINWLVYFYFAGSKARTTVAPTTECKHPTYTTYVLNEVITYLTVYLTQVTKTKHTHTPLIRLTNSTAAIPPINAFPNSSIMGSFSNLTDVLNLISVFWVLLGLTYNIMNVRNKEYFSSCWL